MTLGLVDRWCELCRGSDSPPDLAAFLADQGDVSREQMLELLLIEQQHQWQRWPGPRVEEYLARYPAIAEDSESVLDLVYGEMRARRNLGFPADADAFASRFPSLADRITRQIELASWMDSQLTSTTQRSGEETIPLGTAYRLFGDYELISLVARTGMSDVYRARQRVLGRVVALKMIPAHQHASQEKVRRFENEVRMAAMLEHANILPILEVGEQDRSLYFTSRFIETGTLAENVDRLRGNAEAVARLVQRVALALDYAHQHGVLHRDVKPGNVLIDADGQPLVSDFGLARRMDELGDLTGTGELLGSPVWMAPELAMRQPKPATIACDIYGIGTLLYFLLTGRPPFRGDSLVDILAQVREQDPPRPREIAADVDPDLEMICLKAMDKDPSHRYHTAAAIADDLGRFLHCEPVRARPLPWWERDRRWIRRHPMAAIVAAICVVALALLLGTAAHYTAREKQLSDRFNSLVLDAAEAKRDALRMHDEASVARMNQRQLLYAAHVKGAFEALEAGDVRQTDDFLKRQVPETDVPDLRGLEWYWLRHQIDVATPISMHTLSNPRCARYSPDQRWLAVGDSEGNLAVLDAATDDHVAQWTTSHETVESVSFSPDSLSIVTAGHDGTIRVWDVEGKAPVVTFDVPVGASWRAEFIDNHRIVAANRTETLLVLDRRKGSQPLPTASGCGKVRAVAAAPARGWFAALGDLGVSLFDAASSERIGSVRFPGGNANCKVLRFSPSENYMAHDDGGHRILVYSVDHSGSVTSNRQQTMLDEVRDVGFSADEKWLAAGSNTGGIYAWPVGNLDEQHDDSTRPQMMWQGHEGRIHAIAWSTSGFRLASVANDDRLRIWQPTITQPPEIVVENAFSEPHSADVVLVPGRSLLVAPGDDGLALHEFGRAKKLRHPLVADRRYVTSAVSSDGRFLAAAGDESDPFLELWELVSPSPRRVWKIEDQGSRALAFSPDGLLLAVVDWWNDEVRLFDRITGKIVVSLSCPQGWAAAFAPSGSQLAVTTRNELNVWKCEDWSRQYQLVGHRSRPTSLAWSPDGRWIASGSTDRSIRVWDAASGKERFRMLAHRDEVEHLVFTADGKSIVSASLDGCVKVWHVATGEFVCDLWTSKPNPPVRFALDDESRELYIRLQNGQIIRFLTGSQNKIPVMPHSASRDDTPPSPSRIDKGDKLAPEQPG